MGNQSSNSHDIYTRRVSSGAGARTGIAKDQLVFIIICAVAVTVAVVTLVHSFSRGPKVLPSTWQCVEVDCGYEFTLEKEPTAPVKCPKCGGQAARLAYRVCAACGEKVLFCRVHMELPPEGSASAGLGMQPTSVQYWVKQEDGSFGWSPWISAASPEAQQMMSRNMVCPVCGESTSLSDARGAGRER